ncbi:Pr6Pr family membrane protein [Ferruginibacter sp.]|nr:Pr6Pr family membrane protein [Ferruginibacter sp.]
MPSSTKIYSAIGAAAGWIALLLQLYLIIINRVASLPETIVRYFSFFTILTNLLVAISFTLIYFKGITTEGHFLTRPKTLTATTVYITIVGLIYNIILRFQWAPEGLAKLVDELLHTVIPIGFIIFWGKFVPKQNITWATVLPWTIYPLAYLGYTLLRGSFAQWYPYPFVDVMALGYNKVFINSAMVCATFIFFSLLFVGIAKMMHKRSA